MRGILFNHFVPLSYTFWRNNLSFAYSTHLKDSFQMKRIRKIPTNPLHFVQQCLRKNQYVNLVLNAKHISDLHFDRDWYHNWLIFGFDDEKALFHAVGFAVDVTCHAFTFQTIKIRYNELTQALPASRKESGYSRIDMMNPHLCWLPKDFAPPKISMPLVRRQVFWYAYNLLPFLFNAHIYPLFAQKINKTYPNNDTSFDLHPFRVLQEHKTLMREMMTDLVPESQAAEQYKTVQSRTNAMLMAALKYNMTKKNKLKALDAICETLAWLRKEEPPIFRAFYRELRAQGRKRA